MRAITAAIAAAAITAVLVGGVAIATSSNETITACAHNRTGAMRYSSSGTCKSTETAITWNQQGVGVGDGDGYGIPYSRVTAVADVAGCPAGEIRLILTVTGEDLYPSGPTECRTITVQTLFSIPPNEGAPLATLYSSQVPRTFGGPPEDYIVIDIEGGNKLMVSFHCGSEIDGALICEAYGETYSEYPDSRSLTYEEWQRVIDTGLYTSAGVNQLLP
jgi:hypothetical protein